MRIRFISFLVVLLAWWVGSLFAGDLTLPGPFDVLGEFTHLIVTGRLGSALRLSLAALLLGGALSILLGIPLGIVMGVRPLLGRAFEHYFSALYVMPMSAIVPLLVLWIGIDITARIVFILIFTLPQIVITCYQGAQHVPDDLLEVARAFRASEREIFWNVIIPFEIPFIVAALRLGVGRAIQGMVVAELLLAGTRGLGFLIETASASLNLSGVLSIVLFLMLLGVVATALVHQLELSLAPWQRELVADRTK